MSRIHPGFSQILYSRRDSLDVVSMAPTPKLEKRQKWGWLGSAFLLNRRLFFAFGSNANAEHEPVVYIKEII